MYCPQMKLHLLIQLANTIEKSLFDCVLLKELSALKLAAVLFAIELAK